MALLLHTVAEAQVLSPKGRFSVDYSRGCPPYTVTVTTLNTSQDEIFYLLRYSTDGGTYRRDFLTPVDGNPQTFSIEKVDPEIWLVQAITTDAGTVDRDSLELRSYTPVSPTFEVYACSNNKAVAEITDRSYDYYEVYFGAATSPLRADASNNYTVSSAILPSGTNTVKVSGWYNNSQNSCESLSTTVEVYASLPKPALKGLQWNPQTQEVKLEYNLSSQISYQLERYSSASGSYEMVFPLGENSTDTSFTQAGLANQYFCYRIKALDVCGSDHVVSDELCTASWQLTAYDGYNQLDYQTSPSFTGTVQILRANGTLLNSQTTSAGSYKDEGVICREEYCYVLQLLPSAASPAAAVSSPQCVVAQSNQPLPAVQNISSLWRSNNRLVVYPQFSQSSQKLALSVLNEANRKVAAGEGDSLVYNIEPSPACYFFTYASTCVSQAAPATKFCPLYLSNTASEMDEFLPTWNEYVGYADGVEYYVLQELNENGGVIAEWNTGSATSYDLFPVFTLADNGRRFRVLAYPSEGGLAPSISNVFTFELIMKGYYPNAFSPNGDEVNDEFRILGKFVTEATLWIYDRWGKLIFFSTDKETGWNGVYEGKLLPPGPYVYKSEVLTQDGKHSTLSGTIFLKR